MRRPILETWDPSPHACELLGAAGHAGAIRERLAAIGLDDFRRRVHEAGRSLAGRNRPPDFIPRIIAADAWRTIEAGITQRLTALNRFLRDVYHDRHILSEGIIPEDLVLRNPWYRPEMRGVDVPHGVYVHIYGPDIVRGADGALLVLEDNTRLPYGASMAVELRRATQRFFPDLVADLPVRPVEDYGTRLRATLRSLATHLADDPLIVVLSHNAEDSEHLFLAREMDVPLLLGRDLVVDDSAVWFVSDEGRDRVHAILRLYREDYLDPMAFGVPSRMGIPGLMQAYRAGHVVIANAIGTGIADDKAVYAHVPAMIRHYLGEEPLLPQIPTRWCGDPEGLAATLDHLPELVVKPVDSSGANAVFIGPAAGRAEIDACRQRLKADPGRYVSQPFLEISVCPTLGADGIEARHVDLRAFALASTKTRVMPGGLTRAAAPSTTVIDTRPGSAAKDTWVIE